MARFTDIVVDAVDPPRLARFWASALDDYAIRPYEAAEIERLEALGLTPDTDPTFALDGPGPTFFFQRVERAQTNHDARRAHAHHRSAVFSLPCAQRPSEAEPAPRAARSYSDLRRKGVQESRAPPSLGRFRHHIRVHARNDDRREDEDESQR